MMQTALYRHFDAAGRLLYVGISLSVLTRLSQHMAASSWADEIASMTVARFATRDEAHAAEREAIRTENPLHNLMRYALKLEAGGADESDEANLEPVVDEDEAQVERDAERARYELLRGAVSYKPIYTLEEASKALGIYHLDIVHWMAAGECGHVVLGKQVRNYPAQGGAPHVYRKLGMTGWQLIDLIEILHQQAVTGDQLLSERSGEEPKPTLLKEPITTPAPQVAA